MQGVQYKEKGFMGYKRFMASLVTVLPVFAVVFILGSTVVMGAGALSAAQERANRIKCATNLRMIGQALQLYVADQRQYPRGAHDLNKPLGKGFSGAKTPGGKDVEVNDPTRPLYLLISECGLTPMAFICPSSTQKMDLLGLDPKDIKPATQPASTQPSDYIDIVLNSPHGDETKRSNFESADNLSYSITNPYPSRDAALAGYKWSPNVGADFVIAADRNDADPKAFVDMTANSPAEKQKAMNSNNHAQEGQNVLYNDGHVDWVTTPWVGAKKDNIFTSQKLDQWPNPQGELDTVLVPRKGDGF